MLSRTVSMLGTGVVGFVCGYELCSLEHKQRAQLLLKINEIFEIEGKKLNGMFEEIRRELKNTSCALKPSKDT
jgi:hypothetical protein